MATDPRAAGRDPAPGAGSPRLDRRTCLAALAGMLVSSPARPALAAETLAFEDIYSGVSVLGLTVSEKTKSLAGREVGMRGFMAPPLKAEAQFFVLTSAPMALCPFCSTDADWPDNIVVVYLRKRQVFVQANALIAVTGRLELGSWTDPDTGFVSLLRLRDASFATA